MTGNPLDQLLDQFIAQGVPGCALSVTLHGKTVYTGYRGVARVEDGRRIDGTTLYQILSNTKNVTTTAVMRLYEQGRILLTDPIENYLPSFRGIRYQTYEGSGEVKQLPTSHPITVQNLLTMTSGLPSPGKGSMTQYEYAQKLPNPYQLPTSELAVQLSGIPLAFDPGTHWHYGMGFEVLGALVEAVTGKTFGQYLQEEIFDPLEMKDTTFLFRSSMADRLASIYFLQEGTCTRLNIGPRMTEENGNRCESGGGGLISTLEDMSHLAQMWAMGGVYNGKRILSRNTIDLIRQNHLTGSALEDFRNIADRTWPHYKGYGWGLGVRTLMDRAQAGSNGSVGEFGWCGAAGTYLLADPERELSIMYMHQIFPVDTQSYFHPRIRNVVYAMLDAWEEAANQT